MQQSFGGKGLNQSVAMARAGQEVWHAGFVGNDGKELVAAMKKEGLHLDYLGEANCPTGHAIIQIDEEGQNSIIINAGANAEISEAIIDNVLNNFENGDYLVLQNEVPNVAYAIQKAHDKGMIVFINPSPIETAEDIDNIKLADYIILNEVEGEILSNKENFCDILDRLSIQFPRSTIVLTIGDQGAMCKNSDGVYKQGSYRVNVVDTTAAGDTFTGYFISAISQNLDMEEALRIASIAGAISVSRAGAVNSIPYMEDVRQFRKTVHQL